MSTLAASLTFNTTEEIAHYRGKLTGRGGIKTDHEIFIISRDQQITNQNMYQEYQIILFSV